VPNPSKTTSPGERLADKRRAKPVRFIGLFASIPLLLLHFTEGTLAAFVPSAVWSLMSREAARTDAKTAFVADKPGSRF
jgi:hypothetical protein